MLAHSPPRTHCLPLSNNIFIKKQSRVAIGNTALSYSSFGSLRMPNRRRKMPLNTLGLFTTTTRIRYALLFNGHKARIGQGQYPIQLSPIGLETENRQQDLHQTIQNTPVFCCDHGDTLSWFHPPYACDLCLIPQYATRENRCQSFEKYSINKPDLKERQASAPTHSLLTHSGS